MNPADGIFMSIAEAIGPGSNLKSFEEVRMEDYIKAYQTTGHRPAPCPQEPVDELARKALNLPPLFKPKTVSASSSPTTFGSSVTLSARTRIINPAELPPGQEFRVTTVAGEKYQSMCCMTEYENFSHEELRYYTYLTGNIKPPLPIKMEPFVQPVKSPQHLAPPPAEDKLQNITAQPGYEKHSPEEFRIAYLLYRRELTSAELIQFQNPSVSTPIHPPPPATPIVSTPLSMSALPHPVYASATPSIPKFNFGFK